MIREHSAGLALFLSEWIFAGVAESFNIFLLEIPTHDSVGNNPFICSVAERGETLAFRIFDKLAEVLHSKLCMFAHPRRREDRVRSAKEQTPIIVHQNMNMTRHERQKQKNRPHVVDV